jgi:hypothetical protein
MRLVLAVQPKRLHRIDRDLGCEIPHQDDVIEHGAAGMDEEELARMV